MVYKDKLAKKIEWSKVNCTLLALNTSVETFLRSVFSNTWFHGSWCTFFTNIQIRHLYRTKKVLNWVSNNQKVNLRQLQNYFILSVLLSINKRSKTWHFLVPHSRRPFSAQWPNWQFSQRFNFLYHCNYFYFQKKL